MVWQRLTIWCYATFLVIGGVIGYVKSGSVASPFTASIAALFLLGTQKIGNARTRKMSRLALLGMLALLFCYRALKTGLLIPSGMLALVTLLVLGIVAAIPYRQTS
jgi:uncharacterized membrane protein (UPF0136 family)